MAGANEALRAEHNSRVTAAYYAGLLPNAKKTPPLKDLLIPPKGKPKAKQSWQHIKAAMQVAFPPEQPQPDRKPLNGRKQRNRGAQGRPRAQ